MSCRIDSIIGFTIFSYFIVAWGLFTVEEIDAIFTLNLR